jgi:hypothetical protein
VAEIKKALEGMDRILDPGPKWLGSSFYRAAWGTIFPDIVRLFKRAATSASPTSPVRLDIWADLLARPELILVRPELGSARDDNGPSRAQYSGPLRVKNSAGSAQSSPKARNFFFVRIEIRGQEKWADFWLVNDIQ